MSIERHEKIHFICHKCGEVTPEPGMVPRAEWNPDINADEHFLNCPCGEQDNLERAYPCQACGEFTQLVAGTDFCSPCSEVENPPKDRPSAFDNLRRLD